MSVFPQAYKKTQVISEFILRVYNLPLKSLSSRREELKKLGLNSTDTTTQGCFLLYRRLISPLFVSVNTQQNTGIVTLNGVDRRGWCQLLLLKRIQLIDGMCLQHHMRLYLRQSIPTTATFSLVARLAFSRSMPSRSTDRSLKKDEKDFVRILDFKRVEEGWRWILAKVGDCGDGENHGRRSDLD